MGPQFNPCGRADLSLQDSVYLHASMGPQFNPCGRLRMVVVLVEVIWCFNGAAV